MFFSDVLCEDAVPVSGRIGIQYFEAQTREEKLEHFVSRVSAVMSQTHFLTLDVCKSWMEGKLSPVILSAGITVRCSLFLICLVGNPNQSMTRSFWWWSICWVCSLGPVNYWIKETWRNNVETMLSMQIGGSFWGLSWNQLSSPRFCSCSALVCSDPSREPVVQPPVYMQTHYCP